MGPDRADVDGLAGMPGSNAAPPENRPKSICANVFNAILYLNRTGIPWKYLPHDFPGHGTVYFYYAAWRDEGIFTQFNYDLTVLARGKEGRKPEPTASVIDTQSVKTSTDVPLNSQGNRRREEDRRRKRGILTDTIGLILAVTVAGAGLFRKHHGNTSPRPGQGDVPHRREKLGRHRLQKTPLSNTAPPSESTSRSSAANPGTRLPCREKALGGRAQHRLNHDAPQPRPRLRDPHTTSSEAMIHIASIDNLAKRITDETTPTWRENLLGNKRQSA